MCSSSPIAPSCRAKLALNRRTAPELYIGVRTVTRRDRGLTFDGDGPVVDWVLEMRRFDQATLFYHLADAQWLTLALLRERADRTHRAHRQSRYAPRSPETAATNSRRWCIIPGDGRAAFAWAPRSPSSPPCSG
jgi:aminoglycoside phosphotransferase family enzyme